MVVGYPNIPKDEFEDWLTPAEALLELKPLDANTAAALLQEAARADRLATAAETISREPRGGSASTVATYAIIPHLYWGHISGQSQRANFWKTGLIRMWLAAAAGFMHPTAFRCFNVRFKPEDVRNLKPKPPRLPPGSEPAEPVASTPPEPSAADEQRTRLPDALLTAWYEVFKKTYKEDEITEAKAMQSIRGMFPDHSVARHRVRALLPARKRGRPTSGGE